MVTCQLQVMPVGEALYQLCRHFGRTIAHIPRRLPNYTTLMAKLSYPVLKLGESFLSPTAWQ